ncbi:MAG: hypothetical protein EBS05_01905, partial [Proteobacteria bacterium]|nr:hypothetical protein [Pseudomonadota bacterium]
MSAPASLPMQVFLPKENNNDESARLLDWRVASGERVEAGQTLAEFETSKATFELPAPVNSPIMAVKVVRTVAALVESEWLTEITSKTL